jgi:hypothetical protein
MQSETETHGEVIMVYFKLISQHLSGTTEKNNEKDLARIVCALDLANKIKIELRT